jgi:FlaA1/EpsC-like NDP-sugar epimerase
MFSNKELSFEDYNNSIILVTGWTGSFGHEFIEMTLKSFNPKKLIIPVMR